MCFRLYIAHPARSPLPAPDGFALRVAALAGFPRDVEVLSAERGGCACDLVWAADDADAERARMRQKGWSDSKIQQALDARAHARNQRHPTRAAFERWLTTAVQSAPGLRVLVSVHGEPEASVSEAKDVRVTDFLRSPSGYQGGWVSLQA